MTRTNAQVDGMIGRPCDTLADGTNPADRTNKRLVPLCHSLQASIRVKKVSNRVNQNLPGGRFIHASGRPDVSSDVILSRDVRNDNPESWIFQHVVERRGSVETWMYGLRDHQIQVQ